MFGSLVVIFPTQHQGGTRVLRHHGKEWSFGPSALLVTRVDPPISYIAFWSDVEHEVLPVQSGYRVTVTYNLYFEPDQTHLAVPRVRPLDLVETPFETRLQDLLNDPDYLPEGGLLGFGLRHKYPLPTKVLQMEDDEWNPLQELKQYMKGSDAGLLRTIQKYRLMSTVHELLPGREASETHSARPQMLCEKLIDFAELPADSALWYQLHQCGLGKLTEDYVNENGEVFAEKELAVHWVTRPVDDHNSELSCLAYGNDPWISHTYAQPCLIINVGKFGTRETAE